MISMKTRQYSAMDLLTHAFMLTVLLFAIAAPAGAQLPYAESFDGPDGSAWPSPWYASTSIVTVQDLQSDRGRLNGNTAQVARMILPGFSETDVEVEVTIEFENVAQQGFGFYVRQNGGSLQDTIPFGQGYAMFLKGGWGWPEDLGLWWELNGVETQFSNGYNPIAGGLQNNTRYRLRFRVTQFDAGTTRLQAKVWPETDSEPAAWTSDGFDSSPALQNTAGSFAADLYNQSGTSHIFLDDLWINQYPVPTEVLTGTGGVPQAGSFLRVAPNPFNPATTVYLDLEAAGPVSLKLYDPRGRLAETLLQDIVLSAGNHAIPYRSALPSGVYFLQASTPSSASTQQITLIR